jgi:eukaryotic-like serine/threonine-protein kinase
VSPSDLRDDVLTPGARVGPYDVTEWIGGGGMGEVYRARDARLGRDVALKVLPASFASDAQRLWRFEQEARAAGMINHPGILVVHDFGAHEGRAYLTTELLEGESLRSRLASGPLPARKAADFAAQIARALAAAHDKGIVHRDLKPENVFLTKDGRAKLLDFGLAKLESAPSLGTEPDTVALPSPAGTSSTAPGILLGTMAYLSPEQAQGRPADVRSDIFALGLVFYEMLTGARAFARGSVVETLNAILKEDAPEMVTGSGPLPSSLERIVRRCIEKDPDERFQSARDVAFALDALSSRSEGEIQALFPPEARRFGAWKAWASWRRLGILALASLVIAGAGGALRRPQAPRITGSRPLLNGFQGQPVAWVTDGERVYFTLLRDGRFQSFQMSFSGGEPLPLAVPTRHCVVMDVSTTRSALLVIGWDGGVYEPRYRDLPLWMVPLPAGSPIRLAAKGVAAAWSPDGESIAYVGGSDNYAQKSPALFVARTDGSASRSLWAPADATVWSASWSRDGRWLLVGSYDRIRGQSWVGEMPSDGSRPPRRLAGIVAPNWTPDRRYLVGQVGGEAIGAQSPAERRRVNLVSQRRRQWTDLWRAPEPSPLSFGPMSLFAPVVTPDGRRILAGGSLVRMEPLRFDASTGQFERLSGGITGGFIDYSRDGEWVAWVDATDRTLWRARRDGTERLQITLPPLEVALVRWSPDGLRLAFVGGRSDDPDVVYIVPREGGAPEAVSKPDPAGVWDPCWLPDGRTLVWGNLKIPQGSIRMLDMGTREVSVVPGSQRMMGPKCSPQGTILADKEWSQGWWLYDPRSRTWEDFWRGSITTALSYPTWSRDGRAIYGLSLDQGGIFRLTVEGRRLEKVASLGPIEPTAPSQQPTWMGLDPDDAPVILRNTGMWDLYVLDWDAP